MIEKLKTWYDAAINSIAFYPLILSLVFLGISLFSIGYSAGELDKWLERLFPIFRHSDSEPARNLLSVLAGGLFSLTIFSFSMVMVVINQAANTYSPKILGGFLKDKRPQLILGYYIGSLIYCLPLMLYLAEEKEARMPLAGILLALLLTIFALFLFIWFIDYVSRSVKPYEISRRIYNRAYQNLKKELHRFENTPDSLFIEKTKIERPWIIIRARGTGNFQDIDEERLTQICFEENIRIKVLPRLGDYIIKNSPSFEVFPKIDNNEELLKKVHSCFYFSKLEDIDRNYYFGFRQLTEIAARALSPGINDIGTARICIDLITDLFCMYGHLPTVYARGRGDKVLLILNPVNSGDLFELCMDEIRLCGNKDKNMLYALIQNCSQLLQRKFDNKELRTEVEEFAIKLKKDIQQPHISGSGDYINDAWNSMIGKKL